MIASSCIHASFCFLSQHMLPIMPALLSHVFMLITCNYSQIFLAPHRSLCSVGSRGRPFFAFLCFLGVLVFLPPLGPPGPGGYGNLPPVLCVCAFSPLDRSVPRVAEVQLFTPSFASLFSPWCFLQGCLVGAQPPTTTLVLGLWRVCSPTCAFTLPPRLTG